MGRGARRGAREARWVVQHGDYVRCGRGAGSGSRSARSEKSDGRPKRFGLANRHRGDAGSGTRCPGAWVAVVFACLSFTPSLVPRPGAFQGVVCGITAAIGYGLGVLGARIWREFADRPARPPRRRSWRVFLVVGAGHAAGLVPARAAVAGPDPRPDGRRAGGPRLEAAVAGDGGARLRRPGGRGSRRSAVLPVGGPAAEPVDGAAGRAGAGVGAGRGADRGAGQRGAGGRGHRA